MLKSVFGFLHSTETALVEIIDDLRNCGHDTRPP